MYMINMVNPVLNSIKKLGIICLEVEQNTHFEDELRFYYEHLTLSFKKNVNCGLHCTLFLKNIIHIIKIRYVDFVLKSDLT